jgi:hypothetical protein
MCPVKLAEASTRTLVEFLFYPNNEIRVDRTHNHFVVEPTANRWPAPRKTGCDGIRVLFIRRESATKVSTLSLGGTHVPENQEVVAQLYLRFLARQDDAAFYGEILPS